MDEDQEPRLTAGRVLLSHASCTLGESPARVPLLREAGAPGEAGHMLRASTLALAPLVLLSGGERLQKLVRTIALATHANRAAPAARVRGAGRWLSEQRAGQPAPEGSSSPEGSPPLLWSWSPAGGCSSRRSLASWSRLRGISPPAWGGWGAAPAPYGP